MLSGGLIAVGRGATDIGAILDGGEATAPLTGEPLADEVVEDSDSFIVPFVSGTNLKRLGFVMGIADLVTVRDAIALARAR